MINFQVQAVAIIILFCEAVHFKMSQLFNCVISGRANIMLIYSRIFNRFKEYPDCRFTFVVVHTVY